MIRVDGVCSLFLKLYTITDTKGRRSGIVSAKYRARTTAQNDRKMCKECSELTETYRDEEIHPRYHVYYNGDKNNSKISQRLVYTRIFNSTVQIDPIRLLVCTVSVTHVIHIKH